MSLSDIAVSNVYVHWQEVVRDETHFGAYEFAAQLDTDELRNLAVACDVAESGTREDMALRIVISARHLDEDEMAALVRERHAAIVERRRRAAACN